MVSGIGNSRGEQRISSIEGRVESLENRLSSLANHPEKIEAIEGSQKETNTQVNKQLTQLFEQSKERFNEIERLDRKTVEEAAKLEKLLVDLGGKELEKLFTDIETLKARPVSDTAAIKTLQDKLTDVDKRIGSVDVKSLQEKVNSVEQKSATRDELKQIESKLNAVEKAIPTKPEDLQKLLQGKFVSVDDFKPNDFKTLKDKYEELERAGGSPASIKKLINKVSDIEQVVTDINNKFVDKSTIEAMQSKISALENASSPKVLKELSDRVGILEGNAKKTNIESLQQRIKDLETYKGDIERFIPYVDFKNYGNSCGVVFGAGVTKPANDPNSILVGDKEMFCSVSYGIQYEGEAVDFYRTVLRYRGLTENEKTKPVVWRMFESGFFAIATSGINRYFRLGINVDIPSLLQSIGEEPYLYDERSNRKPRVVFLSGHKHPVTFNGSYLRHTDDSPNHF